MDEKIIVACATDDNFCQHCGVMLYSMLNNSKNSSKILINVFYIDKKLSLSNRRKLKLVVKEFDSVIKFFKISNEKLVFKECYHITLDSYLRIFMSDYLVNYKKFIYVDSDIIFLGDIFELWNLNIEKKVIAAVPFVSKDYL
ncbi:MAG: glycosyltransferase, partial [Candidatus ainarchaeum sp.]|nr:glycosyltransferase [Candidatus ainarchaeum sp.]